MKNKRLILVITVIAVLAVIVIFIFSEKIFFRKQPQKIDQGFREYVSAFTSGLVSNQTKIRIKLTTAYSLDIEPGAAVPSGIFRFDPSIKGTASWVDSQTLEFTPENPLISGREYKGSFELGKIIHVPEKFRSFPLSFQVIRQGLRVTVKDLKPYRPDFPGVYKLEGEIQTADFIEDIIIENMITAGRDNKEYSLFWSHDQDKKIHHFQVDSIQRKTEDDSLILKWDGHSHGLDISGSETIEIPGMNNFKLLGAKVIQMPGQYILLTFSDPLLQNQDLSGLIRIENEENLKFSIDLNQVSVYLSSRITGLRDIHIENTIKNFTGYNLGNSEVKTIAFEANKPAVRLIGKGVIIPNSTGLVLPFEAVNLKSVDVSVVRIYEDNIAQFLQVNEIDGDYQMQRVGRLIASKKIDLAEESALDFGQWNAFSVDISKLISAEPGAIYRVELNFKKKYSLFPCADSNNTEESEEENDVWDDYSASQQSYWDGVDGYYYDDYYYGYYDYNWEERDDPCSNSYYWNKKVSRNILASDLGIIAKSGHGNELFVAVTGITTTEPLGNVKIEVLNFQQQSIGSGITGNDGMAVIHCEMKPFLLVASKDEQRGYLKVNDGNSLSLSKFDVQGMDVSEGIKGFIYGERGVWRPGDSLFLTFILEDREHVLPPDHPVSFELHSPDGKFMQRMVKATGIDNFYRFATKTAPEAPTGVWRAVVKVGGSSFTRMFRIETVKPNRLKINLDFKTKLLVAGTSDITGALSVKWLHGANAGNLQAKTDLTLKPVATRFPAFKEYNFDDPSIAFSPAEFTVFDGNTDHSGNALVKANVTVNEKIPGMLEAVFFTKVFETGGDFSVHQMSIPYAPYPVFAGVKVPKGDVARGMLLTDEEHKIEVATVDPEGNKVSVNNLQARVYKLEWEWWWHSGSNNLASYFSRDYVQPVVEKNFSTTDGFGSFSFEIKNPDWGRYLIHVMIPGGHSTGQIVYIDWPGWAGRGQRENPGGTSMLSFTSDKDAYTVGETAKVTFPGSEGGTALISLESGDRVLSTHWVKTQKDETSFAFSVTDDMAPNIYVNISLIQPHAQSLNDLPIRQYGVKPLLVYNPMTKLEPALLMADELRPEKEVSITVKEKKGHPMTFTLAIVDEGLLDLTGFKTPDPWAHFYAREALSVKTWDLYDLILGAYGARIEKVFAIGGDAETLKVSDKKAERFKPVVKFFGPFTIDRNAEKKINFIMPRYVGSVRAMLVAGHEGAYGQSEKTVPVKNPLMITATLPRVLSPSEKVRLPVTVFAMNNQVKDVTVTLTANEYFQVNGPKTQQVHFDNIGEKDIMFDLAVAKKPGVGSVHLKAVSGGEQAAFDIELDVRPPNPPKSITYSKLLNPDEEWEQSYEVFGIEGANKTTLEVSGMPSLNLERRLNYLIQYPYGCLEQIISSVFPQLYLEKLSEMTQNQRSRVQTNIEHGIEKLKSYQLPEGGFSYWPQHTAVNDWASTYAGHFLIECKRAGYAIPGSMFNKWISYQQNMANHWARNVSDYPRNDFIQAYRLFTLALADKPDLGSMNRLREDGALSLQAKYFLAYAYLLAGNKKAAEVILAGAKANIEDYTELSWTYGSGVRDRAIVLKTLITMNKMDEVMLLIESISRSLSSYSWMSTQTTAWCLMAMADAAGLFDPKANIFRFRYKTGTESPAEGVSDGIISRINLETGPPGTKTFWLKNTSTVPFYAGFCVEGVPLTPDNEPVEKNLKINAAYKDINNNVIDPARLIQATDFRLEITVSHPGLLDEYKEMALTTMFPSGWEIINTRMFEAGSAVKADVPSYQDIRDDRVYTFFDILPGKTKTFVFLLNASYLGEFYLPAIQCGAMYSDHIQARIPGKTVKIVRAGE
ncbi:MAG: alpha-2-macroglobulin [Bacteroidales bacterium]|nr:alpha-2-macroglobulin [Bacteroidales bacterium]